MDPKDPKNGEFGVQPPRFTDRETESHRRESVSNTIKLGQAGMRFPLRLEFFSSLPHVVSSAKKEGRKSS